MSMIHILIIMEYTVDRNENEHHTYILIVSKRIPPEVASLCHNPDKAREGREKSNLCIIALIIISGPCSYRLKSWRGLSPPAGCIVYLFKLGCGELVSGDLRAAHHCLSLASLARLTHSLETLAPLVEPGSSPGLVCWSPDPGR